MLEHDDILAEMIRQIDAGDVRQVDVAKKLSIAPARVSEMRKGTRRIQPAEMPILAKMLGLGGHQLDTEIRPVARTAQIRHLGKVAQGLWLEQTISDEDHFVSYDMRAGDPSETDLFAVTPEGASMNLKFPAGLELICRRVPFGNGYFKPGDYVIVERQRHDVRELTCKRVEIDDLGNYWLHSESDQPRFQEPWLIGKPDNGLFVDTEIAIIGKVIRGVIDFEK